MVRIRAWAALGEWGELVVATAYATRARSLSVSGEHCDVCTRGGGHGAGVELGVGVAGRGVGRGVRPRGQHVRTHLR